MDDLSSMASPWISDSLERWSILTEGRKLIRIKKETSLYHQGDPFDLVYLIHSGRVRITSYQTDGSERQLYIAEKGSLIGENSFVLRQPHTSSAVAIVDSLVYAIPYAELSDLLQKNFSLCQNVMQMICRKHNILYSQLLEKSFSQSLRRISQVLLNLVKQYGEPTPQGVRIGIRFTHQDVANITGISRVTVSNTLNRLADEGVLGRQDGLYLLYNLPQLRQYIEE